MEERKTKLNCWEVMKCGHEGTNAGRLCWVVAGSLCGGTIQGSFAEKFRNREKCDFYRLVKIEEFPRFKLSAMLLAKLKEPVGAL